MQIQSDKCDRVYNMMIIKIEPSQVALLVKIIGHLTEMITYLPLAESSMEVQTISCLFLLPCSALTGATGVNSDLMTVLPKHQILYFSTLMQSYNYISKLSQYVCSTNYLVLKRQGIIELKIVLDGFIFFILPEKIFYGKLLQYFYHGEPDQNFLSLERGRTHDKSLND